MGQTMNELVDGALILSTEHQNHLDKLIEEHRWRFDAEKRTFTLTSEDGRTLVCPLQVVGSSAPGPNTWLWAWHNVNGFPPQVIAAAERVRAEALDRDVAELLVAEVPLQPALPYRFITAAKYLSGLFTHYSGANEQGSRIWVLLDHPSLVLPAPTVLRVVRAITEAHSGGELTSHLFAIQSYAWYRHIAMTRTGPYEYVLEASDGGVTVAFDEQWRLIRIAGTARDAG